MAPSLPTCDMEQSIIELERQNECMVKQYQALLSMKAAVSNIAGLTAERKNSLLEDNRMLRDLLANVMREKRKTPPYVLRADGPSGREQINRVQPVGQEEDVEPQDIHSICATNRGAAPQNPAPSPTSWVGSRSHTSWDSAPSSAAQPAIWEQTNTTFTWEACN